MNRTAGTGLSQSRERVNVAVCGRPWNRRD